MAPQTERPARYIIMPREGFTDPALLTATFQPSNRAVAVTARAFAAVQPRMRVIDTIRENGPKLVEMPPEGELSLRLSMPGLKIVPEVFYHRQWHRPEPEKRPARRTAVARAAARPVQAQIKVVDRTSGNAVRAATVIAFTDFANRVGAQGSSDANGLVRLAGISSQQALERLYVYGPPGYWGYYKTNTRAGANSTIKLRPVDIHDPKLPAPIIRQLAGHCRRRRYRGNYRHWH